MLINKHTLLEYLRIASDEIMKTERLSTNDRTAAANRLERTIKEIEEMPSQMVWVNPR